MLRSRLRLTSSKLSSCGLACAEISSCQVPRKFAEKIFASARGEWARRSGATVSEDNKVQKQIGLCKSCVPLSTEGIYIKKERDTRARNFMQAKILTFVPLFQQWLSMVIHIVVELKNRFSVRNREDDDAVALAAHI